MQQPTVRPLSGLSFFGLPVEALASLTYYDFAPGTPYSAAAYAARRPAGTPLLASPAPAPPPAPSAYARAAIAAVLGGRASGLSAAESLNSVTPDDQRVVAELQLALSEVAAEAAGGPVSAPPAAPDPGVPAALGAPFAASVAPSPPWLPAALAASLARASLRGGPPAEPAYSAGEDPVAYASASSAFWRGVPPLGWGGASDGAARAAALAAAAAAGAPGIAAAPPPPRPPADPGPPAWALEGAAALAALAGPGGGGAAPPHLGPQGLGEAAARRYAAALRAPPALGGRQVLVFTPATAAACLAAADVMGDFETEGA